VTCVMPAKSQAETPFVSPVTAIVAVLLIGGRSGRYRILIECGVGDQLGGWDENYHRCELIGPQHANCKERARKWK
jgi:hypothetical protein